MAVVIREFLHEGGIYYHDMDTYQDTVVLKDFNGVPLILYTANGVAEVVEKQVDPHKYPRNKSVGSRLGTFHMGDVNWYFKRVGGEIINKYISVGLPEGLLDFEVEISKMWLSKHIPLNTKPVPRRGTVKQYLDKKRSIKQKKHRGY